jgi:predicted enzyme related to lactoylglutathione lyase
MDMKSKGTYYVLNKDGIGRAGLMQSTQPNAPPAWLPYVSVADCDATARRATALAAKILVPPMDIPDVGRFTVFMDPAGAVLGAIRGKFTG